MRRGRPIPALKLTETERESLNQWMRRPKSAQVPGAAGTNHYGVRRRIEQYAGGSSVASHRANGWKVAQPVCPKATRWFAGRTEAGHVAAAEG